MSMIKIYKRTIAEGKGLVFFAILFAAVMRIVFYIAADRVVEPMSSFGFFCNPLIAFCNQYEVVSAILSIVAIGAIALLANYINSEHVLIRAKTMLPVAFVVLLFSFDVGFFEMNVQYISAFAILLVISALFASYNNNYKQQGAFLASFILSIASLLDISVLVYLPMLWLSLPIMRCFSFKSILASLFSLVLVYFPLFSYYLLTEQLHIFCAHFEEIAALQLFGFSFAISEPITWIIASFTVLLFILIFVNNYIDSFKDKIKTRAYNGLLALFLAYSFAAFLFIQISPTTYQYVAFGIASLVLSHFFALAGEKWKLWLFFIYILLYLTLCCINLYAFI